MKNGKIILLSLLLFVLLNNIALAEDKQIIIDNCTFALPDNWLVQIDTLDDLGIYLLANSPDSLMFLDVAIDTNLNDLDTNTIFILALEELFLIEEDSLKNSIKPIPILINDIHYLHSTVEGRLGLEPLWGYMIISFRIAKLEDTVWIIHFYIHHSIYESQNELIEYIWGSFYEIR